MSGDDKPLEACCPNRPGSPSVPRYSDEHGEQDNVESHPTPPGSALRCSLLNESSRQDHEGEGGRGYPLWLITFEEGKAHDKNRGGCANLRVDGL